MCGRDNTSDITLFFHSTRLVFGSAQGGLGSHVRTHSSLDNQQRGLRMPIIHTRVSCPRTYCDVPIDRLASKHATSALPLQWKPPRICGCSEHSSTTSDTLQIFRQSPRARLLDATTAAPTIPYTNTDKWDLRTNYSYMHPVYTPDMITEADTAILRDGPAGEAS